MRRFTLLRSIDVTGVSGTGIIAEGIRFSDDTVVIRWLGERSSTVLWHRMQDAIDIHGHDGATRVVWHDPPRAPGEGLPEPVLAQ